MIPGGRDDVDWVGAIEVAHSSGIAKLRAVRARERARMETILPTQTHEKLQAVLGKRRYHLQEPVCCSTQDFLERLRLPLPEGTQ